MEFTKCDASACHECAIHNRSPRPQGPLGTRTHESSGIHVRLRDVGAVSTGSVMAARLSEDPSRGPSAGGRASDTNDKIHIPAAAGQLFNRGGLLHQANAQTVHYPVRALQDWLRLRHGVGRRASSTGPLSSAWLTRR